MEGLSHPRQAGRKEPRLLLEWGSAHDPIRSARAAAGSLILHVLGVLAVLFLPIGTATIREAPLVMAGLREPTKLVAPPAELTQRAPNVGETSKEIDLEGLLARPRLEAPRPPETVGPAAKPSVFVPPARTDEAPLLPAPPRLETAQAKLPPPLLGAEAGLVEAPPQIRAEETPKLAFETPGSPAGEPGAQDQPLARLERPSTSITEVGRDFARGGAGKGLVIGDPTGGLGGPGGGMNLPPMPGRTASSVELLSDPMGVDFRPYLTKVLWSVRRNWYAVMPESAKLGRRGRTVIQFAIDRDGSVPKLVIAMPSGTDALDRAAVAGISASNPFPPLPGDFRGENIRLQLVFLYNVRGN